MLPLSFLELSWDPEEAHDPEERWYDEDDQPVSYPDWTPETSRVVSGPYGPAHITKFPGKRFPDRASARRYWGVRARILEEYKVPGRYIFRIKK